MDLHVITRVVVDWEVSRAFYEEVLGFERAYAYEPTRWQSYQCQDGTYFAIGEAPGSTDETSFAVADVEALWARVKDRVEIVHPLEQTPWGTYRFVIKDPDGHLLAFMRKDA